MRRSIAFAVAAGIACLFISTAAQATDAIWGTASGNWSTVSATNGWTNAVPDAVGDTGTYDTTGHSSVTTTQDITGNRTVGKLEVKGSSTGSWTITLASGKNLVMDQDGAGPGVATLSNTQTVTGATSGGLIIGPNLGQIILNDDLLISNTGTSTRTSGSIQIDSAITGGHNVTYYNVSNDIGHGQIALQRNGATGSSYNNTTIAKGAVTFNRGDRFSPNANLFITLGSEANGDATLAYISAGGLGNMENSFIVAANTGGTTVFGTSAAVTGLTNIKSSGAGGQRLSDFNLLGDISYMSGGTGTLQIGGAIIGVGKVTKIGPGPMRVLSTNSYSGGTVVNEGSLAVGHADQITNCCGTYPATDGTLGSGNVTVNSTATFLQIESSLAAVNVIANSATLSLAGGGTPDVADQGYAQLDAGIKEVVGTLLLNGTAQAAHLTYGSLASNALIKSDEFFAGTGVVSVGLAADYNGDGTVDAADYVTWRKNPDGFGGTGGYDLWQQNFGAVAVPGAGASLGGLQAVPEPSTLLLIIAGASLAWAGRRRR